MLRFLSLAVAILLILGGPASANAPLVLRVGYYEGGPFVDYHASLRAIAEALVERQMIPPVDFPPPSDADSNEAMWAALATASRVGAIRFVESAFWSADWQDDKRMETRRQVMADLSGGSINLMLALGTWAGQDLANDSHSVPTLVISASDPIASGIVESAEDSGRDHIHAEFDPERYIRQIRLFHGIVGFKRIGVALEDSDDGRAWSNLGVLRDAGQDLGFDVATCFTPDSNVSLEQARVGVMRCWSELAPRVDAVWVGVHRGEGPEFMPAILEPLFANKIPTWSQLGIEAVRRGVVFSVARRDHRDLGRYYADVVSQVLAGVKPRQIGQVFVHDKAIVINARTAQIIGRDIPPGLRSAADTVFERIEGASMKSRSVWTALGLAAAIGVVYWIVDGVVGYITYRDYLREIIFQEPIDLWDSLFLRIPAHHLSNRISVLLACLAGGGVAAYLLNRREEAKRALRESEARFRYMANAAPLAIALKDLDRRFTWLNEEALARSEMTLDEMVGKTTYDILAKETADQITALEDAALESGQPQMRQIQTQLPDGIARTEMIIRYPILNTDGVAVGIGGMGMDVSEQRLIERQLLQAQKMEVVGQLTGGIAHDFNNLLQVIETSLDLVRKKFPQDDKLRRMVENAFNAGRRGAKLTQQLLSFSRKQALSPKTLDPNETIDGMLKLLGRTLGEDIRIETRLDPEIGSVFADENALENAVFNIVLNARAAMPDGGTLTLSTASKIIGADSIPDENGFLIPAGDYVEIAVADSGHGMSEEDLSRAFEPFFTTKEVGEGTGLGLSMVYGFACQSGGIATLESAAGKGTTARILLPEAASLDEAVSEPAKPSMTSVKCGKILVVEDDAVVRESTVMLMESFGYTVREAEDAGAALKAIDREPDIALLMTDMVMPGDMSGLDLAHEATRRNGALKAVIVTGYSENDLKKKGLSAGGFRVLSKPFTAEQLDSLLGAAFDD